MSRPVLMPAMASPAGPKPSTQAGSGDPRARGPARPVARRAGETRTRLLAAAGKAFATKGYFGTDTNAIARAAGFAPATFYKHFADKRAIFVAVYETLIAGLWRELSAIAAAPAPDIAAQAVAAVIRHHVRHRLVRAAMQVLALSDPDMAALRRTQRSGHLARLQGLLAGRGPAADGVLLAALFLIERTADAIAEGELNAESAEGRALIAEATARLDALLAPAGQPSATGGR